MGAIMILCPRTGMYVSTGIETDEKSYAKMDDGRFRLHCWRCGGDHDWSKRWARFVADAPPEHGTRKRERSTVKAL